jgi:hypothetical protein
MTSTDTIVENHTPARPAPEPNEAAVPSRRRQREASRPAPGTDRVPALAALDAADDFILVTRQGGRLRVFSDGRLVVLDAAGGAIPEAELTDAEALLPFLVADESRTADSAAAPPVLEEDLDDEQVDAATPSAENAAPSAGFDGVPASLLPPETLQTMPPHAAAALAFDPLPVFVLDEGDEDPSELGETDRVPGLSRGSESEERVAPDLSDGPFTSVALVLPDGRRIDAPDYVLVGRSPSDPGAPGTAPELVALSAKLTDISRTHLELRGDGDALLARDLGSMNGTVLARPGHAPQLVPADSPVLVLPGDALILGGSATIEIEGVR